ncbi:hypothetical protein A2310_04775 [candidate division WOR-1 bacterium RIFOXYB2_FULL_37_13]|uniref:Uncharacterized protein n=1 Tax=candidate division WOR-1 bacterium RIFOXYB2_FULL_37_13 TaxID=1802579 RepID=A0A1F4SQS9_UNCSA|nr:MAG: hypothetical protein A2310_04775 [candidate division WOR-1 bacterium RIFOXYB2_FULL_37_13]
MKLAKILARRLNALDGETSSMARYICSFTTRRSPMDFAALKQLAGIVKRVEGSKNKLVDFYVAKMTNAIIAGSLESTGFCTIVKIAGKEEKIVNAIRNRLNAISIYDVLNRLYSFSLGIAEIDDTLIDAVIERARDLFVERNLDFAKGTPLFNAVVISYVEELSPNSGSIEEGIDGIEATIKRIATPALLDAILEKLGGDLQLDEDASSLF